MEMIAACPLIADSLKWMAQASCDGFTPLRMLVR
jgi:hypothetical protein